MHTSQGTLPSGYRGTFLRVGRGSAIHATLVQRGKGREPVLHRSSGRLVSGVAGLAGESLDRAVELLARLLSYR